MPNITPNVEFDTLAREWRCKWSPDDDKASLAACQDALTAIIAEVSISPSNHQRQTAEERNPAPPPDPSSREGRGAQRHTMNRPTLDPWTCTFNATLSLHA